MSAPALDRTTNAAPQIAAFLLCSLLLGCDGYTQIPVRGTKWTYLNYYEVCVEGVTYILTYSGGLAAKFGEDSKVIRCK